MKEDSKNLIRKVVGEVALERAIVNAMVLGSGFYMVNNKNTGIEYIPLESVIIDGKPN